MGHPDLQKEDLLFQIFCLLMILSYLPKPGSNKLELSRLPEQLRKASRQKVSSMKFKVPFSSNTTLFDSSEIAPTEDSGRY